MQWPISAFGWAVDLKRPSQGYLATAGLCVGRAAVASIIGVVGAFDTSVDGIDSREARTDETNAYLSIAEQLSGQ